MNDNNGACYPGSGPTPIEPESRIDLLFATAEELGAIPKASKSKYQIERHFGQVDFRGKRVLEIGGGTGLLSLYAHCRGAARVVCLEPEEAGSSAGMNETFTLLKSALSADDVVLERSTIQGYDFRGEQFDVVLMRDSVNHLDEPACIRLARDVEARRSYQQIFRLISDLTAAPGRLILSDCSSRNFFAMLGIRNPLATMIEWHKHQPPRFWIRMLEEAGFANPKVTWSSFSRLGFPGRVLLGNAPASFFLISHFYIEMQKES